jgi:hypothetical protein
MKRYSHLSALFVILLSCLSCQIRNHNELKNLHSLTRSLPVFEHLALDDVGLKTLVVSRGGGANNLGHLNCGIRSSDDALICFGDNGFISEVAEVGQTIALSSGKHSFCAVNYLSFRRKICETAYQQS